MQKSDAIKQFVDNKLKNYELMYGNDSGKYSYMTGYLQAMLESIANCKSIKEVNSILEMHIKQG